MVLVFFLSHAFARTSQWHTCNFAPMFVAFLPALLSTELGGLRYGFSFLAPTALLWQRPDAKKSNNGMYQLML